MDERLRRRNYGPCRPLMTFPGGDYEVSGACGTCLLRMTVEYIAWSHPERRPDGIWYKVRGVEAADDHGRHRLREVLVRGSRLGRLPTNRRL